MIATADALMAVFGVRRVADYTGPNLMFRGYYVREVRQSGTQRRSLYLEIVGTGRTIRVGRKTFEREARAV